MGQFKPMVKMQTTEPSVILKLKKGGHVNMKDGGKAESGHKKMASGGAMEMLGMTPAFVGRPAVNAPVKNPGKPSMSARKKAMAAKKTSAKKPPMPMPKAMPMMPPMKEGGKADKSQDKAMIKKAFKQHDAQEHKGGKGTKLALKKGGKMATGGVAMKNAGGFKDGGEIGCKTGDVKMVTAKKMATGGVAKANAGGYATGGVAMANAGGFKHGGKTSKKAYATGGTVDSGKPVAMKEGSKSVPEPKRQQNFSGTYKKGGEVENMAFGGKPMPKTTPRPMPMNQKPAQTIRTAPVGTSMATRDLFASMGKTPRYKGGGGVGNKRLQKINEVQNAPALKASKADTNLKYPETMNSPQKTPKVK